MPIFRKDRIGKGSHQSKEKTIHEVCRFPAKYPCHSRRSCLCNRRFFCTLTRSHPKPKSLPADAERVKQIPIPIHSPFNPSQPTSPPEPSVPSLERKEERAPPLKCSRNRKRHRRHREAGGEHPEKSKTKTSPFGLVFVFREIIEFKFKRVYLRSFFTFGICRRFIETSESDAI